jgi:hypothetical protein
MMGSYSEEIGKIKIKLSEGRPIWIPERKVLVIPPNYHEKLRRLGFVVGKGGRGPSTSFVIWLGAENPQICRVICTSMHRLARYVLKGEIADNDIHIATDDEIRQCREILDNAKEEIDRIEEPYRSRLMSLLVFKKLSL